VKSRSQLAVVIAMSALLGACTSLHPVSDWHSLHEGDKVRVTTGPDNASVSLKILAVTPESIEGKTHKHSESTIIPSDQIASVEVRRTSPVKTTLLVIGIGALTVAAISAAAAGALAGNLAGPSAAVAVP